MRPDRNLALDLWQHESTHVLTDGRWREVELFLPADLNLSEVTDYLYSAILLNASEAGEFVARLSVGTRIGQIGGWCKWRAHYLPGPLGFLGGGRRPPCIGRFHPGPDGDPDRHRLSIHPAEAPRPRRSVITSGTAR